jgi:hypothetical protein
MLEKLIVQRQGIARQCLLRDSCVKIIFTICYHWFCSKVAKTGGSTSFTDLAYLESGLLESMNCDTVKGRTFTKNN